MSYITDYLNVFTIVEEGLIYYFNSNHYIGEYYREFKDSKEQVIKDINSEMKLLDELRVKGLMDQVTNITKVVNNGPRESEISNQITVLSEYREKIRTRRCGDILWLNSSWCGKS